MNLGQGGLQRHDLRFELGQRLRLAEVRPFVVLLADARSQRPLDVGLRIFVPLGLYRDRGLFEAHTARNGAALPVNDLTLWKVLCFQKNITRLAARAVLLLLAAQQNSLVSGKVAEYLQERDVGLQGVQRLAIDREILVRLQKESSYRLFHSQM